MKFRFGLDQETNITLERVVEKTNNRWEGRDNNDNIRLAGWCCCVSKLTPGNCLMIDGCLLQIIDNHLIHCALIPISFPVGRTHWLHHVNTRGHTAARGFSPALVHVTRGLSATRDWLARITGTIEDGGNIQPCHTTFLLWKTMLNINIYLELVGASIGRQLFREYPKIHWFDIVTHTSSTMYIYHMDFWFLSLPNAQVASLLSQQSLISSELIVVVAAVLNVSD